MRTFSIWLVIVFIVILGGFWYWQSAQAPTIPPQTATSTTPNSSPQSTSDGTIQFTTPNEFGLAVTPQQVLVKSYIPPCEDGFTYCLYYSGSAYKGTNFESAGLSVKKRADLSSERLCLGTPPDGFDASTKPAANSTGSGYSTSVFTNIGDAAAGHTASGSLYRLFVRSNSSCYEFLARVGQTQFANYPAGSIQEFTAADKNAMQQILLGVLGSITLTSGEKINFAH